MIYKRWYCGIFAVTVLRALAVFVVIAGITGSGLIDFRLEMQLAICFAP